MYTAQIVVPLESEEHHRLKGFADDPTKVEVVVEVSGYAGTLCRFHYKCIYRCSQTNFRSRLLARVRTKHMVPVLQRRVVDSPAELCLLPSTLSSLYLPKEWFHTACEIWRASTRPPFRMSQYYTGCSAREYQISSPETGTMHSPECETICPSLQTKGTGHYPVSLFNHDTLVGPLSSRG